jgi:hypothetical protein
LRVKAGKAMSMTYESFAAAQSGSPQQVIAEATLHGWTWPALGAVLGLAGGAGCVLCGSIITAATWLTGAAGYGPFLHKLGTILLVLTIPLLLFGGHCLDLIEQQRDREQERRFRDA